jgi:surface protein
MKNIASKSFRLLLVLAGLIVGVGNVCAQEMYAVLLNGTATFYYDSSQKGKAGRIFPITNGNKIFPVFADKWSVKKIIIDPSFADARPTSTANWFYDLNNLEVITGIEYLNTEDVTDMSFMFYLCEGLTSLDVSNFDTSKVTDMSYMFEACRCLTTLDVSNFDTSNVESMSGMFEDCKALTSLDLSNFNTSKLVGMTRIFERCTSMTVLDVSNFDTSNVSYMRSIFADCESLTTIYGNNWDTSKVASENYPNWANSQWIFNHCYSLVGGKGTRYSWNTIDDNSYARIDGGESAPGYFTEKNPTGISEVADRPNASSVYNLQGYRIPGTPQKGLYIRNGKKYVVK